MEEVSAGHLEFGLGLTPTLPYHLYVLGWGGGVKILDVGDECVEKMSTGHLEQWLAV